MNKSANQIGKFMLVPLLACLGAIIYRQRLQSGFLPVLFSPVLEMHGTTSLFLSSVQTLDIFQTAGFAIYWLYAAYPDKTRPPSSTRWPSGPSLCANEKTTHGTCPDFAKWHSHYPTKAHAQNLSRRGHSETINLGTEKMEPQSPNKPAGLLNPQFPNNPWPVDTDQTHFAV